jgi:hypothetical protein
MAHYPNVLGKDLKKSKFVEKPGKKIEAWRREYEREKKMSTVEFCAAVGITPGDLIQIEEAFETADSEKISKVVKALGKTMTDALGV